MSLPVGQVEALKALDRMIGPRIVAVMRLMGLAAPPAEGGVVPRPDAPRSIVVVRPGGIGDAVLIYPLLKALRGRWPNVSLELIAERRNAGIFATNSLVRRVWRYDRELPALLRRLREDPPDILIDTEQSHILSALVARLSGASIRLGFDTNVRREAFSHVVPYNFNTYEVYSFLQFAEALTGEAPVFDPEAPFLDVAPEHREWAGEILAPDDGRPILCLSPSASIPRKRWPWQNFHALARWAMEKGRRVVLIGGSDSHAEADLIQDGDGRILNLVGKTSLPRTAAIIQRSRVFVSPDTGVLHIAFGVGTPTVLLFGPGVLSKWAPIGSNYLALTKNLPCSPCMTFGYTRPCTIDQKCMKLITVEETRDAIERLLERSPGKITPS